jgi:hypothetical protein
MIRNLTFVLLSIFFLASCASDSGFRSLAEAFRNADTPEEKSFLACVGTLGVAEVYRENVRRGQEDPGVAHAKLVKLQKITARLRIIEPGGAGDWANVEKARIVHELVGPLKELVAEYRADIITDFATISWRTALQQLEEVARYAVTMRAAFEDGLLLLDQVEANTQSISDVLDSCDIRTESIKQELANKAGVASLVPKAWALPESWLARAGAS